MYKARNILSLLLVVVLLSCEEVVDIDLKESEPRLVIEASVTWVKDTDGSHQQIKLSTTAPFYEEDNPGVEDAVVKIFTEGEEFNFRHSEAGMYQNHNFRPVLNQSYELEILHENEIYSATGELIPVTDIDFIEQTSGGGFSGDEIEIKVFYTDPVNVNNFYLFSFRNTNLALEIYDDTFNDGNQIFGYYSNEDIEPGDKMNIQMEGISKAYYEYLFALRSQAGRNGGGPFETQPATVRGNIKNKTNPDNYALGYFRLSEADTINYIVE